MTTALIFIDSEGEVAFDAGYHAPTFTVRALLSPTWNNIRVCVDTVVVRIDGIGEAKLYEEFIKAKGILDESKDVVTALAWHITRRPSDLVANWDELSLLR